MMKILFDLLQNKNKISLINYDGKTIKVSIYS